MVDQIPDSFEEFMKGPKNAVHASLGGLAESRIAALKELESINNTLKTMESEVSAGKPIRLGGYLSEEGYGESFLGVMGRLKKLAESTHSDDPISSKIQAAQGLQQKIASQNQGKFSDYRESDVKRQRPGMSGMS